ncbi:hypothetical protein DV714_13960 [Parageobacillus thermoglucosidasius]|nr:hypothetical protein DV714_13960 [Parageobacillus thermoglucosidasius]
MNYAIACPGWLSFESIVRRGILCRFFWNLFLDMENTKNTKHLNPFSGCQLVNMHAKLFKIERTVMERERFELF